MCPLLRGFTVVLPEVLNTVLLVVAIHFSWHPWYLDVMSCHSYTHFRLDANVLLYCTSIECAEKPLYTESVSSFLTV